MTKEQEIQALIERPGTMFDGPHSNLHGKQDTGDLARIWGDVPTETSEF